MKLGTENRKQIIIAGSLAVVLLLVVVFQFMPSSSTIASTSVPAASGGPEVQAPAKPARPAGRRGSNAAGKKERPAQSLDPTLNLRQLAYSEQIKYEGSGRNIFVSQAEAVSIPKPLAPGQTDPKAGPNIYTPPAVVQAPPIPLKFFGFASKPGEPKKIFLIKGDDTFVAGEGEIVDRRYKVVRITPTSVEIQDVVNSGPPQSIPLTQG